MDSKLGDDNQDGDQKKVENLYCIPHRISLAHKQYHWPTNSITGHGNGINSTAILTGIVEFKLDMKLFMMLGKYGHHPIYFAIATCICL